LVDVVNHGAPHADFRTSSVKPRTRGVSRGFRFRLGGTCDGEGKTHHNRCSTPAVSSEQHPRLLALLAILSPRCGHALSFLWVARFARRRWGNRVTVSPGHGPGLSFRASALRLANVTQCHEK